MNKKMLLVATGAFVGIALFINSCTYRSKEIQYPASKACDTTAVTYSGTIAPLLTDFCYECHASAVSAANGGGIVLDSYNPAKIQALYGTMLQSVRHDPGFNAMPKDRTKLSDCNIARIRIWIEAGAPNN